VRVCPSEGSGREAFRFENDGLFAILKHAEFPKYLKESIALLAKKRKMK
jgi:hypothetical protein